MKQYVLHETEEEVLQRKNIRLEIIGACMAGVWGIPLTIVTYFLFEHWGAKFPAISWGTPIVLPLFFVLMIFIGSKTERNLVFTNKYLKAFPRL